MSKLYNLNGTISYESFVNNLQLQGKYILTGCPFCGDTERQHHLSLNLVTQVFYCFRCHQGGSFKRLGELFNINELFLIKDIKTKFNLPPDLVREPLLASSRKHLINNRNKLTNEGKIYLQTRKVFNYITKYKLKVFSMEPDYIGFDFKDITILRKLCTKKYKIYMNDSYSISAINSLEWLNKNTDNLDTLVIVEGLFDVISSNILIPNSFAIGMLTNHIKPIPIIDSLNKTKVKKIILALDKDVDFNNQLKRIITTVLRRIEMPISLYTLVYNKEKDLNEILIANKQIQIKEITVSDLYKIYNQRRTL